MNNFCEELKCSKCKEIAVKESSSSIMICKNFHVSCVVCLKGVDASHSKCFELMNIYI